MLDPLMAVAAPLGEQVAALPGGQLYDTRHLVQAAALGYLAGTGVPTNQAVQMVTAMTARGLVTPSVANPMYHGLPWMVPGPVSGAPYYE